MAFSERIKLIIDVTTSTATSQIGRLRTELQNTEGTFNKVRTAGAGAFDLAKQNAAQFIALAGTALAGFATKAVSDFQDVALGAGQLRDSLGVTADEASRLQEVAQDVGIGVGTLETGIGRMNRAAADTPEAFDEIGAAIVRNADGTVNVTETFLSATEALRRIPDATRRAAAAQKIFGRGWQDMAELIGMGAEGIREAMDSVEAGKIVNDQQINDARRFRDALDALKGNVEELSTAVGGFLVPRLADAAEQLQMIIDLAKDLELPEIVGWAEDVKDAWPDSLPPLLPSDQIGWLGDRLGDLKDDLVDLGGEIEGTASLLDVDLAPALDAVAGAAAGGHVEVDNVAVAIDAMAGAAGNAIDDVNEVAIALEAGIGGAAEAAVQGLRDVEAQWDSLTGALDANDAYRNVEQAFDDLQAAAEAAFAAASSGSAEAEGAVRDHEASVDDLKRRVIEYGREVAGLPPEQVTDILAQIDQGKFAEVESRLAELEETRRVTLQVTAVAMNSLVGAAIGGLTRSTTVRSPTGGGSNTPQRRARGGPVGAGEPVIVGDRFGVNSPSAEMFVPDRSGTVVPLYPNGGPTLTATVDSAAIAAAMVRGMAGVETMIYNAVSSAMRAEQRNLASALRAGQRFG